jgi:hypothetical protein
MEYCWWEKLVWMVISFSFLLTKSLQLSVGSFRGMTTGTAVTVHELWGRQLHIKRDDLLYFDDMEGKVNGNKVRKLHSLHHMKPFPKVVISAGGIQSNAMRALALLCQHKQSRVIYITSPISKSLKSTSIGNLADSMDAGMEVWCHQDLINQFDLISLIDSRDIRVTNSQDNHQKRS